MAEKIFPKFFGGFKGMDLRSSELTRQPGYCYWLQNFEMGSSDSLCGRRGSKPVTQALLPYGIFTYSRNSSLDGSTVDELLCLEKGLWKMLNATLILTRTAGGIFWNWQMQYDQSVNAFKFTMNQGTGDPSMTPVTLNGSPFVQCDKGNNPNASPTIHDLITYIAATGNFTAQFQDNNGVAFKFAKVNGTQNGVNTVNVFAGHTFIAGDVLVFYNQALGAGWEYRLVSSVTATTITFNNGVASFLANQILGIRSMSCQCIPVNTYPFHAPNGNIPMNYLWPIWDTFQNPYNTINRPFAPSFINFKNNCYFAHSGNFFLAKYDGQKTYNACVPKQTTAPILALVAAGAGVDIGDHTYATTLTQIDNQGLINESTMSSPTTITVTGGNQQVNVTFSTLFNSGGFNTDMATVNGNQSGGGTSTGLTVTAGHSLKPGDTVCFLNRAVSPPVLVTRILSSATIPLGTALVWASSPNVTVTNGDVISANLRVNIYRSKLGGINRYLVASIPNNSSSGSAIYSDVIPDANLGIQYLFPVNNPDALSDNNSLFAPYFLDVHQGLMIAARSRNAPNTFCWTDPLFPEGFPASKNTADIDATAPGGITCIRSDTNNKYAVFKGRAYFSYDGDFATQSFIVNKVSNGDFGVASHAGTIKIKDTIVGVGELGPIAINSGRIDFSMGDPIQPLIKDAFLLGNPLLGFGAYKGTLTLSVAVNDFENERAIFVCGTFPYPLVYEYRNQLWGLLYYFPQENLPTGFTTYNNQFYMIAANALSKRAKFDDMAVFNPVPNNRFPHDFIDNTDIIYYDFIPTAEALGEPSVEKELQRLKLYNFDFNNSLTAFTLNVNLYYNYDFSQPNTLSNTQYFFTLALNGNANEFAFANFPTKKAKAMQLEFWMGTTLQRPVITGYELSIAASSVKEDIRK